MSFPICAHLRGGIQAGKKDIAKKNIIGDVKHKPEKRRRVEEREKKTW